MIGRAALAHTSASTSAIRSPHSPHSPRSPRESEKARASEGAPPEGKDAVAPPTAESSLHAWASGFDEDAEDDEADDDEEQVPVAGSQAASTPVAKSGVAQHILRRQPSKLSNEGNKPRLLPRTGI